MDMDIYHIWCMHIFIIKNDIYIHTHVYKSVYAVNNFFIIYFFRIKTFFSRGV